MMMSSVFSDKLVYFTDINIQANNDNTSCYTIITYVMFIYHFLGII